MVKEMACRKCKHIFVGKVCPLCKSSDLTPDWTGVVIVADPQNSAIAKTLGIMQKGKYAIRIA